MMPRPKREGAPEPKKRSRNGCWPCKARKVKCGEERPRCLNCERQGEACDYSIRLNWGGRSKKDQNDDVSITSVASDNLTSFFPTAEALIGSPAPSVSTTYSEPDVHSRRPRGHTRVRSNLSLPPGDTSDRELSPYRSSPAPTSAPASAAIKQERDFGDYGMLGLPGFPPPMPQRAVTSNPVDPRIESLGLLGSPNYPSSVSPALSSPNFAQGLASPNTALRNEVVNQTNTLLPPFRTIGSVSPRATTPEPGSSESFGNGGHPAKRMRFTPNNDASSSSLFAPPTLRQHHTYDQPPTSFPTAGLNFNFPLPPTPSNAVEDLAPHQLPQTKNDTQEQPRKLSVNDLLSGPPEDVFTPQSVDSWPVPEADTSSYGFDLGLPDEDVPRNRDAEAIKAITSPEARRLAFPPGAFTVGGSFPDDRDSDEKTTPQAFNKGGYYAKPVAIRIPKALEPLPNRLLQNPMNLLYFHHFLNHTARILVPHDCEQNPFRNILPQMAVQDDSILNLMLAYSASHRARLLQHPEPGNRIAEYVQDVFPKLRKALMSPTHEISAADLGSAIMLASLEILSPNTFDVPITWQNHLHIAREMIIARGGPQSVHKKDKVAYFLSRWFAYLDVLGSLSGSRNDWPLSSTYWNQDDAEMEDEFQIDCLLGFTSRCVGILARISELAKECEQDRIDASGQVKPNWRPSGEVVKQAEELKKELQQSRGHVSRSCSHRRPSTPLHPISESELAWDSLEIYATNEAFHWAGLIHLTRRVLGRPGNDPEVQNAVREIVGALYKVRRGSTAEACLLFPMFTAGCDASDPMQREKIMERLRGLEGFGMHQVNKARKLMEKVWESGKPWESLVEGEFFG